MTYLGFDRAAHTGEMVVHEKYAAAIVGVFHRLYDARWPIQRMRLVDDYRGDNERSMAASNTSGYNWLQLSPDLGTRSPVRPCVRRRDRHQPPCRTPISPNRPSTRERRHDSPVSTGLRTPRPPRCDQGR
jgi:hypothetical protein